MPLLSVSSRTTGGAHEPPRVHLLNRLRDGAVELDTLLRRELRQQPLAQLVVSESGPGVHRAKTLTAWQGSPP